MRENDDGAKRDKSVFALLGLVWNDSQEKDGDARFKFQVSS